jgi:hypothetical protein
MGEDREGTEIVGATLSEVEGWSPVKNFVGESLPSTSLRTVSLSNRVGSRKAKGEAIPPGRDFASVNKRLPYERQLFIMVFAARRYRKNDRNLFGFSDTSNSNYHCSNSHLAVFLGKEALAFRPIR